MLETLQGSDIAVGEPDRAALRVSCTVQINIHGACVNVSFPHQSVLYT